VLDQTNKVIFHDVEGQARFLRTARDAVELKPANPARFIVHSVLKEEPQYPDDVAVMMIFFE
jgi:hypothetical protein